MNLPEHFTVPTAEIDRLFPFHLLIHIVSGQIVNAGPGFEFLTSTEPVQMTLGEQFHIVRADQQALDVDAIRLTNTPLILKHKSVGLNLVGLIIPVDNKHSLFAGYRPAPAPNSPLDICMNASADSICTSAPNNILTHNPDEGNRAESKEPITCLKNLSMVDNITDQHVHTDELTGIANRRLFWSEGNKIIHSINSESIGVILLIDLDGFRKINSNFSHAAGDRVLEVTAQRCNSAISDSAVTARLDGDEFVILCKCTEIRDIEKLIDKLIGELKKPIEWQDQKLMVRASMGASFISSKQSVDDALQRADLAMHQGRKQNHGLVSWFTPAMKNLQAHRDSILACIEQSIEEKEIAPYFQPIVDLQTGEIHGFEALARWHHPAHGMVFPDLFIDIAAEAGCLHKLDMLILESSLDQLVEWEKRRKFYTMHVNLSATSVLPGLENKIFTMLEQRGLSADRLILELTETTVLDFDNQTKLVLNQLARYGVAIQLDDFGTGYSSLTHLHDLPINGIKIDRSFLFNFPDNSRSIALIETVMDIAMRLGLEVVTEGIETIEQSRWITSLGSKFGQGYLFGKPAPAEECETCTSRWNVRSDKAA